jgi:hypothetical protein
MAASHFAENLRRLQEAQKQAVEIARIFSGGELKLEEAATKLAIQLIMEMLIKTNELKGPGRQQVVKVLGVLARLQNSNVLREKMTSDFRAAVERSRSALIAGVRRAVGNDDKLRQNLQRLVVTQAEELLSR